MYGGGFGGHDTDCCAIGSCFRRLSHFSDNRVLWVSRKDLSEADRNDPKVNPMGRRGRPGGTPTPQIARMAILRGFGEPTEMNLRRSFRVGETKSWSEVHKARAKCAKLHFPETLSPRPLLQSLDVVFPVETVSTWWQVQVSGEPEPAQETILVRSSSRCAGSGAGSMVKSASSVMTAR